jgi:CheY-like chemotaxis protein
MYCKGIIKKNSFATEIASAMNGQQGIDYYKTLLNSPEADKSNYPNLIFLDLNMPIMNGWEFLDEFVKTYYVQFPKTKVVILTSSIDPKDEERASEYSIAIDFLSKPLTGTMLNDLRTLFQSDI